MEIKGIRLYNLLFTGLLFLLLAIGVVYFLNRNYFSGSDTPSKEAKGSYELEQGRKFYFQEDYEQALSMLTRAAKLENGEAMCLMGIIYHFVDGHVDYEKAIDWYEKAAKKKNPLALNNLGAIYSSEGELQDHKKAFKYFKSAADLESPLAMRNVGYCYLKGEGVKEDKAEAVACFLKAANKNDVMAQRILGSIYFEGDGVEKDWDQSFRWYKEAASNSDAISQYRLALMYEEGFGIEADRKEAHKWYKESADNGYTLAIEWIAEYEAEQNEIAQKQMIGRKKIEEEKKRVAQKQAAEKNNIEEEKERIAQKQEEERKRVENEKRRIEREKEEKRKSFTIDYNINAFGRKGTSDRLCIKSISITHNSTILRMTYTAGRDGLAEVDFILRNPSDSRSSAIECGGKSYKKLYFSGIGNVTPVKRGQTISYTVVYEKIPDDAKSFQLIDMKPYGAVFPIVHLPDRTY